MLPVKPMPVLDRFLCKNAILAIMRIRKERPFLGVFGENQVFRGAGTDAPRPQQRARNLHAPRKRSPRFGPDSKLRNGRFVMSARHRSNQAASDPDDQGDNAPADGGDKVIINMAYKPLICLAHDFLRVRKA